VTAPQRRRAVAAVAVWLLAVGVAGVLSWRAIDSAGRQVVAPVPIGQPSADAPAPTASHSPTSEAPTAPTSSSSSTEPARTVSTRGGTAAASCTDGVAVVTYATPTVGWRVEVEPEDGGDMRVDFRSDEDRVRVRFTCRTGGPEGETEEDGNGSGHVDG
jgi:hypothetical protein